MEIEVAMLVSENACRPWNSPFRQSDIRKASGRSSGYELAIYVIDEQEKIDRCLSCTKAKCNNCLSPRNKSKVVHAYAD